MTVTECTNGVKGGNPIVNVNPLSVGKVTLLPPVHVRPVVHNGTAYATHKSPRVDARTLAVRRALTFGVIGEDSKMYPSSKWKSEKQSEFSGERPGDATDRQGFVITSLDARSHKPQTTQIFHIKRINKKPVCSVQWMGNGKNTDDVKGDTESVYNVSYQQRQREPLHIVHKDEKEKVADGCVVPVNILGDKNDVRSEMMLPVCDSTMIESAHNPHRYLLRKRKVPPPNKLEKACGVIYPPPEKPSVSSMSLPENRPRTGIPQTNVKQEPERTSVSSLSGYEFSRRKYIPPPPHHIRSGFDGGVPAKTSGRFCDNLMPFMRAKTII